MLAREIILRVSLAQFSTAVLTAYMGLGVQTLARISFAASMLLAGSLHTSSLLSGS